MQARSHRWLSLGVAACLLLAGAAALAAELPLARTSASSSQPGSTASGAADGDRFSVEASRVWKGQPDQKQWWWQCRFAEPRPVGAILQVAGDDSLRLENAPQSSIWQTSLDGRSWQDIKETAVDDERRTFRLHRLKQPVVAKYLRLKIDRAHGAYPALREVEVFAEPQANVDFGDWLLIVSTLDRGEWDARHPAGSEFVALARECKGFESVPAQHVWIGTCDEALAAAEPRPLCAFLSGNFSDWCQKDRAAWRGMEEVLTAGHLPIWASCGGAQGLAILADVGTMEPWDCPHCRDPDAPKCAIYGHIGHTDEGPHACGDYAHCISERGPTNILQVADDPALRGLPREFASVESHCGQIEYVPRGWVQVATCGSGGKTAMQCLRVKDRYIYAAQFHIELPGTPASSRRIMSNFLELARAWGGYNPAARPVAAPRPLAGK